MTPTLRADGVVICGAANCGRELHLDRQSWADAERLGHHKVRITCGFHDVWLQYRAPLVELRVTIPRLSANSSRRCKHCHEPLEAERKHPAELHLECRKPYRRAKEDAKGAPRRQRRTLRTRPGALARVEHERTMAGPRRKALGGEHG